MKLGIPAESAKQIASFLVGYGLITDEQLSHATASSSEGDKGLMDTIIEYGFADEKSIVKALSETYEVDYIDLLDDKSVDLSTISVLPKKFICENRVVPIRDHGEILDVVISEPSALNIMASIRLLTDKKIHAYITTFSQIDQFLTNLNDLPLTQSEEDRESIVQKEVNQNQARSSIVIDFVDKALKKAIKLGGSDIHLEIYKKFARMRFRLDGVLIDQKDQNQTLFEHYAAIVTRIKIMSKLDIAERRLPQDGAMSLQIGKKEVDFRVSVLPTSFGERVVMRILDTSSISLTIETLVFL
jgi:type IV pilus assembly protein PilB